jgi:hypothetical protein
LIIYDYLKVVEEQERLYGRDYERFVLTVPRIWPRRKSEAGETDS